MTTLTPEDIVLSSCTPRRRIRPGPTEYLPRPSLVCESYGPQIRNNMVEKLLWAASKDSTLFSFFKTIRLIYDKFDISRDPKTVRKIGDILSYGEERPFMWSNRDFRGA
jgi:hypothetical protein